MGLRKLVPALALGLAACANPCPAGTVADAARTARLDALLAGVGVASPTAAVCYGPPPSGIDPGGALRLDATLADPEAAARLAHLALHAADGFTDVGGPPCDAAVARALDAEARGYVREVEVRAGLGVDAPVVVLPFEADVRAAAPADRVGVVRRWLDAHPDGGGGVEGLAAAYAARCAAK